MTSNLDRPLEHYVSYLSSLLTDCEGVASPSWSSILRGESQRPLRLWCSAIKDSKCFLRWRSSSLRIWWRRISDQSCWQCKSRGDSLTDLWESQSRDFVLILFIMTCITSLSVTEGVAASGGVGLSTAELVLDPVEEDNWTVAGVDAATGTFLSKPCWLTVLDTDD